MKKVAFALGFAGAALISYSAYRGVSRARIKYSIGALVNAPSAYAATPASYTDADREEASTTSPSGSRHVDPVQKPQVPAAIELKKARDCFDADVPCAGYLKSSYPAYQRDILTHMQAIAESEYQAVLSGATPLTPAHEMFGRDLLADQQPEIQAIGIKFLSLFNPSQENLDSLSNCLAHTLNEELFEQGVELIRDRYKGHGDFDQGIRDMLAQQIQFGIDEVTSHRAAQELFQYLDRGSFRTFLVLEQKLVPFPERYTALNSVLNEYSASHHFVP